MHNTAQPDEWPKRRPCPSTCLRGLGARRYLFPETARKVASDARQPEARTNTPTDSRPQLRQVRCGCAMPATARQTKQVGHWPLRIRRRMLIRADSRCRHRPGRLRSSSPRGIEQPHKAIDVRCQVVVVCGTCCSFST